MNNSRTPRAVHQSGYADVLLRPTMVGILRCGKMLPPQLNLVIESEFADATLRCGLRTPERARREPFNRALLSCSAFPRCTQQQSTAPPGVAGAQRHRGASRNSFVTFWDNNAGSKIHLLARGRTWPPSARPGRKTFFLESQMQLGSLHFLCATSTSTVLATCATASSRASDRVPKMPLSGVSLARFTFKALDGTMTDVFIHLTAQEPAHDQ